MDSRRHEQTEEALRQLGTNAVPYLVELSFRVSRPPAGQAEFYGVLNAFLRWRNLPEAVSPDVLALHAPFALKDIRPPADQLLPLLESHLESTNPIEHLGALIILGTAGEGAERVVPYLEQALRGPDLGPRYGAVQSLMWIGPGGRAAVPTLVDLLQATVDTNYLGTPVAIALGKIGSNAAPSIPLVRALFDRETNWNYRCSQAGALVRMDAGQTNALAFLVDGLTNHQPAGDRWIAAMQLGEIGPAAKAAVPALIDVVDGTNVMLASQVPYALRRIGVPVETCLPKFRQLLLSGDEIVRVNAAARILEIDPADPGAHRVLIDLVQKGSIFRGFAIGVLANAGPSAADAIPVLQWVVKNGAQQDRAAATQALRRIRKK